MRTLVLIIGMLVVVGGGFYFVALRDRPDMVGNETPRERPAIAANTSRPSDGTSSVGATAKPALPASLPAKNDPNASIIGQSSGVFVESRDPRTGRITHKFRAQALDPQRDGTVGVTRPEVRFYGKNRGGLIVLEGSQGTVTTSSGGNPDDPRAIGASTPTNGQLNDVTLRFYDEPTDAALKADEERLLQTPATITVKIPAVKFDALANRVATFDGTIDGKPVPAERMPVTVRGRDFELDGQGLTLTWNDRTGRLESLVIERGDRLLVTDVNRFGGSTLLSHAPLQRPAVAGRHGLRFAFSPADVLNGVVAVESTTGPATKQAETKDLYNVTFDREVRVTRSGTQVASADALNVAMLLGESKDDANVTTAPASGPTSRSTTRPNRPNRTASTKPADPVEVHWTGKLTVRPADADLTGQTVELIGAPAWVREGGAEARGNAIRVEPEAGRLRIAPGGDVKEIEIRDADGGSLTSTSALSVDKASGRIVVDGPGSLNVPANRTSAATTAPATQPTRVAWSRRLKIDLAETNRPGAEKPSQYLKEITIDGDADVKSDAMTATAQSLTLAFTEPAADAKPAKPAADGEGRFAMPAADFSHLRMVEAIGAAKLVTVDAKTAREQSMSADRVRIDLKQGTAGPVVTSLAGDGGVNLRNADGSTLSSASLDVQLDPKAAGEAAGNAFDQIRKLVAAGDVRLLQADGSRASADRVETAADHRLKLTGKPAEVATGKGALRGETIDLDPESGNVLVPGPGAFVGTGDAAAGQASAMALSWVGSMSADATAGVCNLKDGVRVDGTDAKGSRLQVAAGSALIKFETSKADPATRPAGDSAVAGVSLESIRSLQLAEVESIAMSTVDGTRESTIETPTLDIDFVAGTVIAPKAGRMLLVSRSTPTTQPTTQTLVTVEPVANDDEGGVGPGSLALAWQDSMNWQMRQGDLTMAGGVRVGFEKENSDDPIRLNADTLKCTLAPVEPMPQDDGQSANGVDQVAQRLDLKTVNAIGNVTVRSKQISLNAGTLSYELLTDQATASADDQTQLEVFNADGSSQVGFSSFVWNVQTGKGEFLNVGARMRR